MEEIVEKLKNIIVQENDKLRNELKATINQENDKLRNELKATINQENDKLRNELKTTINQENDKLRNEFHQENDKLREEMNQKFNDVHKQMDSLSQEMNQNMNDLRKEILDRQFVFENEYGTKIDAIFEYVQFHQKNNLKRFERITDLEKQVEVLKVHDFEYEKRLSVLERKKDNLYSENC